MLTLSPTNSKSVYNSNAINIVEFKRPETDRKQADDFQFLSNSTIQQADTRDSSLVTSGARLRFN